MFKLYPYQEETKRKIVSLLNEHGICYLSAEERFGKNLSSMSALQEVGAKNVLYVTVKAAIGGIKSDHDLGQFNFDLTVINYESVHKMTGVYDAIVFDESTKLAAFPKPTKATKETFKIVSKSKPKYMMWLNATPAVESYSQFFHQLKVGGLWKEYKTFYLWHREFGLPNTKRVAGGMLVADYSKTKEDLILGIISSFMIKGTREDAGFEFTDAKINLHEVSLDEKSLEAYDNILNNGLHGDIIADSAVKVMSKLQQLTGGFMYDDDGVAIHYNNTKLNYLVQNVRGKKVAIYAKYTWEVEAIKKVLSACTDPYDFKTNGYSVLVQQVKSGAKGVDLSFCDQHWFYSLDFSGETFIQGIARQHNKKRKKEVQVEILHTGLIDLDVFNTVSNKKLFNSELFRSLK